MLLLGIRLLRIRTDSNWLRIDNRLQETKSILLVINSRFSMTDTSLVRIKSKMEI